MGDRLPILEQPTERPALCRECHCSVDRRARHADCECADAGAEHCQASASRQRSPGRRRQARSRASMRTSSNVSRPIGCGESSSMGSPVSPGGATRHQERGQTAGARLLAGARRTPCTDPRPGHWRSKSSHRPDARRRPLGSPAMTAPQHPFPACGSESANAVTTLPRGNSAESTRPPTPRHAEPQQWKTPRDPASRTGSRPRCRRERGLRESGTVSSAEYRTANRSLRA